MARGTSNITHGCPPAGWGVTTCCGRRVGEVPRADHITLDQDEVTCDGRGRIRLRLVRTPGKGRGC